MVVLYFVMGGCVVGGLYGVLLVFGWFDGNGNLLVVVDFC